MSFSLWRQLNQPFPQQNSGRKGLVDSALTGLFVAAFLYFLQPFDMTLSGIPPLWDSLAYGLVTFAVNVAYNVFCEKALGLKTDIDTWTLWKWIVRVTGLIICIAIANFLYFNFSYGWSQFNPGAFGRMLVNTFVVGLFPTIVFGLIVQLRASKANLQSAAEIDTSPASSHCDKHTAQRESGARELSFGDSSADGLLIDSSAVRYIEAMQNYISVCHVSDGKLNRHLIRQTLSSAEQLCLESTIIKCHRSFLVNTARIESVSGNAQGLKLVLDSVDDAEVPVSRSYIADLRRVLASAP